MTKLTQVKVPYSSRLFRTNVHHRTIITDGFRKILRQTVGFQADYTWELKQREDRGWCCFELTKGWYEREYTFLVKDPTKAMLLKLSLDAV